MPLQPLINLQSKVTQETYNLYESTLQNTEAKTRGEFVEMLLEAFLNPKTKPVPTPTEEQTQALQLLNNEIGRLKSAYSVIEANNQELQAEILRLTNLNSDLETRNAELENNNPEPAPAPQLADDQILLTIPPIISAAIEAEQQAAKKKSGKDFTVGDILLNNFWESIVNGRSYPFRVWSSAELANLAKKVKEAQQ